MRVEIRIEEVINWFRDNDIPICKSRIYLSRPFKVKGMENSAGVFLPRFYEGYIFVVDSLDEVIRRYVHESSHGSFFENFPVGKQIHKLDKRVYEKERELFGEKSIEDIYIITTSNSRVKSRKIGLEEARKLTRRKVQFETNKDIFEINRSEFKEYSKLSEQLSLLYSEFVTYLEGFALIVTEEITRDNLGSSPLFGSYKSGYELLKAIKEKNGLKGLIQELYRLELNI